MARRSSREKKNCQRCHDADPFISTVYIAPHLKNILINSGWNPLNEKYTPNFQGIFDPNKSPFRFLPKKTQCIGCHYFGELTSQKSEESVPLLDNIIKNQSMPPGHGLSEDQWKKKYMADIKIIKDCAKNIDNSDCGKVLPGYRPIYESGKLKYKYKFIQNDLATNNK